MKCNPTVKDIFEFIDSLAPFSTQCDWDNSGMLVGDRNKTVRKIAVVLDITTEAIEKAAEMNADLIVSHHPVIFRPARSFTDKDLPYVLAKNGIAAICTHTPLDMAKGGVNDTLASVLGFENPVPFAEEGDLAFIRVAEIPATSGESLAKLCADKLSTVVRLADCGKTITKVAVCGGAGAEYLYDVAEAGCDAFITGDGKHHEFLDSKELGLTLIAAGHFETENPVMTVLANKIKENFDVEVGIIPQSSPVVHIN